MIKKDTYCYSELNLREQIYLESRAMAEYSLAKGKYVPVSIIENIEAMEDYSDNEIGENYDPKIRKDISLANIVEAHDFLARLIEPATPQTILLIDMEQKNTSILKFLGAVSLIRQLMMAAIISLTVFVSLMATTFIEGTKLAEDVLSAEGVDQLFRLAFYMSSAGLGASFAALYKANFYISKGTYDPSYQASYWIRFSLGIIAGLLLAILISERTMQSEGFLSNGVARPLLAILGGFSADLLYTFLHRMVETFKSLFESSSQDMLDAKAMEAKAKLASLEIERRMSLAQDLMDIQQKIGSSTDPEEFKQQLNELLQNLVQPHRLRD